MALFDTQNARLALLELDLGSLPSADGTIDSADARQLLGLFPIERESTTPTPEPTPEPTTGLRARDVILQLRDLHIAFTKEDLPTSLLLRMLARRYRRLLTKIIAIRPQVLVGVSQVTTSPGSLDTFPSIALPARLYVQHVTAQLLADSSTAGSVDVDLVGASVLHHTRRFPIAAIEGNTLLLGGVAHDWISYASVTVAYIPSPGIALSEGTALLTPDDALDVLVQGVAADAAQRVAGLSRGISIDPVAYARLAAESESDYLQSITTQMRAEATRIVERW